MKVSDTVLLRPGPQPHNQIGTLAQQFALAHTPRPTPQELNAERLAACIRAHRDIFTKVLLEILAAPIGEFCGEFFAERNRSS
jgi:hypothetical protein